MPKESIPQFFALKDLRFVLAIRDKVMMNRFEGPDGKRHLITALKSCSIVERDEKLADRLAEVGQLVPFEAGDPIITQGATDNDVFSSLSAKPMFLSTTAQWRFEPQAKR